MKHYFLFKHIGFNVFRMVDIPAEYLNIYIDGITNDREYYFGHGEKKYEIYDPETKKSFYIK